MCFALLGLGKLLADELGTGAAHDLDLALAAVAGVDLEAGVVGAQDGQMIVLVDQDPQRRLRPARAAP